MNSEVNELWDAMKNAKYRNTLAEINKIRNTTISDVASKMNEILCTVARAVHAEVGTFWYYSKYIDGRIHPKAAYGGKLLEDFSLAVGEGVAGQVIESVKGCIIEDCQSDSRWSGKSDGSTGFVTRSMMCVPVSDSNDCFGCIQLVNRTDGNLYDDSDYTFLESLANEVSKIVIVYSKDLPRGVYDVFDKMTKMTYDTVFASKNEEDFLDRIKKLQDYIALDVSKAEDFLKHCKTAWEMINYK